MILVIDNYDSFTYNLVQYIGELGRQVRVCRNDEISVEEAGEINPSHIVISPGPGEPKDAGVSNDLISAFAPTTPILGVCLGHQCIAAAFKGGISRAERLLHGKTSPIYHTSNGIFEGLPNTFEATRYHSLIVEETTLPECLKVVAYTSEGEIMGIRLQGLPVHGVQFHPESILSKHGKILLSNFLNSEG
jgi:anthranilate synthase/aminodeoxychorismate synthase-like glutamine amidotransferase